MFKTGTWVQIPHDQAQMDVETSSHVRMYSGTSIDATDSDLGMNILKIY